MIGQFKYVLIRLFLVNFYSHQPFYLREDSRSSVAYCDCWTVEIRLCASFVSSVDDIQSTDFMISSLLVIRLGVPLI